MHSLTDRLLRVYIAALGLTVLTLLDPCTTYAQFGSVINIPPDPDIGDNAGIGSSTQVNVHAGGMIGLSFEVGQPDGSSTNVQLNVEGGLVGNELHANGGSETNVRSGRVGDFMQALAGSVVNISGGNVGNELTVSGGQVNISGGNVGNQLGVAGGEVNISGGNVGSDLVADTNSLVNISGGFVGPYLSAGLPDASSTGVALNISDGFVSGGINVWSGSVTEIVGGLLGWIYGSGGDSFNAQAFSFVEVFGGRVDYDFDTFKDADVHFYGNNFLLDGDPLAVGGALPINLGPQNILEGVLADGTPFALGDALNDQIANATLTLHERSLPPLDATDIFVPPDPAPPSIRDGQTLTLGPGGQLDDFFRAGRGSTLHVVGGTVGRESQAVGANVTVSSGTVGSGFAMLDSTIDITGGRLSDFGEALSGTVLSMSDGVLGFGFLAENGSQINVSGGVVESFFRASSGSEVNISGSIIGTNFNASNGSSVKLFGGDFRLDGVPISGLENPGDMQSVDIPLGSVLSGIFSDGSPFAFARTLANVSDIIDDGTMTLHTTELPSIGPATINLPGDPVPSSIRQGQTLTLNEGGQLGGFNQTFVAGFGSTLIINDGQASGQMKLAGATLDISGGSAGSLQALGGSQVDVSGGTISTLNVFASSVANISDGNVFGVEVRSGGQLNISGGEVGSTFANRPILATDVAEVNISGGTIAGRDVFFGFDTVVNLSGGTFDLNVLAGLRSEINFFASTLLLDGSPIAGLQLGVPAMVNDRDVTLSGTWADGVPFSFELNSTLNFVTDWFHPDAMITVTLVEPDLVTGDLNGDSAVDAADAGVLFANWGAVPPGDPAADFNHDGFVDAADAGVLFAAWTGDGSRHAVPEPSAMTMLWVVMLGLIRHRGP